jgi:transposase
VSKSPKLSPETRARALRMVLEQRGEPPSLLAAMQSIAAMIGRGPHTLYDWVCRYVIDNGMRDGVTSDEAQRIKDLEREVKELRRANEILKLASAFFAQAQLERRLK